MYQHGGFGDLYGSGRFGASTSGNEKYRQHQEPERRRLRSAFDILSQHLRVSIPGIQE